MKQAMLLAALALLMAGGASADPAYKCGARTYSDKPCTGGRPVGASRPARQSGRYAVPPQDRAFLANRARLSPENRRACEALDVELRDLGAALRKLPHEPTPTEEKPWLQTKQKYRDLHC